MAGMLHPQYELVRHLLEVVWLLLVPLCQAAALPALHGPARHGKLRRNARCKEPCARR